MRRAFFASLVPRPLPPVAPPRLSAHDPEYEMFLRAGLDRLGKLHEKAAREREKNGG